jgi:serine/threonine-protein kinase HipA
MNRTVEVFVSLEGADHHVGRLWSRSKGGRESASFRYAEEWLRSAARFPLEPLLTLGPDPHHTPMDKTLFGALGDSAPDRWGRVLMDRLEASTARKEGRAPRKLMEIDYLLLVNDLARQGALRFRPPEGGEFLTGSAQSIPHCVDLPRLLAAAESVLGGSETEEELAILFAPGSSLGGARPKAAVFDAGNQLHIAKFPRKDDAHRVEAWSHLVTTLGRKAGMNVQESRLLEIEDRQVQLLKRFERVGGHRIPFLSAMSMLGARDMEPHSYLEIVDAIRQYGADVDKDLPELWQRMVFTILISNRDDHLRNHGFLFDAERGGWILSPAYDLNPEPGVPRILSTRIDEYDNSASFLLALEVGEYFGLDSRVMRRVTCRIVDALAGWREQAARLNISEQEKERMESAFEHEALRDALAFCRGGGA